MLEYINQERKLKKEITFILHTMANVSEFLKHFRIEEIFGSTTLIYDLEIPFPIMVRSKIQNTASLHLPPIDKFPIADLNNRVLTIENVGPAQLEILSGAPTHNAKIGTLSMGTKNMYFLDATGWRVISNDEFRQIVGPTGPEPPGGRTLNV
jgi:hypothetical protein